MREISILPLAFNSYIFVGEYATVCSAALAIFTLLDTDISSE